jgi:hypothetical protein
VLSGLAGIAWCRHTGQDWRIDAGFVALVIVGLGSVAFHGTMRFYAELFDEVPMLFLILAFLIGKEDCMESMSGAAGRRRFRLLSLSLVALASAVYIALKVYQIFVLAFTFAVVFLVATDVRAPASSCVRVCVRATLRSRCCSRRPRLAVLSSVNQGDPGHEALLLARSRRHRLGQSGVGV